MEKTMVNMVISELNSVPGLQLFLKTDPMGRFNFGMQLFWH